MEWCCWWYCCASSNTDTSINGIPFMIQKVILHLIFIIFTKQMQWSHWCCHWHHMMLMLRASHDQKSHAASLFDHIYPANGMLLLMMLSTSYDTDTSIHSITWPKQLCFTLFQFSWPHEHSGFIDSAIYITWYWWHCQVTEKVELHYILIRLKMY